MSHWKRLMKWVFIGGVGAFLFFANNGVRYQAKALFKEDVEKKTSGNLFNEIMFQGRFPDQTKAISFMKSNEVLRPLVEKLGLQIHSSSSSGCIQNAVSNFRDSWRAERGKSIEDLDPFLFENVHYSSEKAGFFTLFFTNEKEFSVFDETQKKRLEIGVIGSPVCLEGFQFTVKKIPKKAKYNVFYPFFVTHWIHEAGAIRSCVTIKDNIENSSLIDLSFMHRDRYLAVQIVNELMNQYQEYLRREYGYVEKEQLAYLEGKQNQIFAKMDELLTQHCLYMTKNIEENGFFGLDEESQSLLVPHNQISQKIRAIDIELERLSRIKNEGKIVAIAEEGPFSQRLGNILQEVHHLKQQRDLLELSLSEDLPFPSDSKKGELQTVRAQRMEMEKRMQEIRSGQKISACDFDQGLQCWAQGIDSPEEETDFVEYLENYSRLLSMREKIFQERLFSSSPIPEELEGMDRNSARGLYLEYNTKLDGIEAKIRHFKELQKTIPNREVDLASLSAVFNDSFSQQLICDAMRLELQMKDDKHHSVSEEEKWTQEIDLYRKILVDHLGQLSRIEELNKTLVREKMHGLQKISLDAMHHEISVLENQAMDCVKEREEVLLLEKELLEKQVSRLRGSLAEILPQKWRFEKWLSMKSHMISKMMDAVTEIVESKNMSIQLHHVQSKPLDMALLPSVPEPPHLFAMAYVGAFSLPFFLFSLSLIRQALRGFPLSLEKLQALKLPVLGAMSSFCDGPLVETPTGPDLDLLRKIALFSKGSGVVSLLGGKGPDYSFALGENLARTNQKTIVVRCDFLGTHQEGDAPGLLQLWKQEIREPPIRKGKGFDYIASGGFSPFGTEIILSESFRELLAGLKKKYERIFLYFSSPLSSAESMAALNISDQAVITISSECTEELTPFIDWGYDEASCRLRLITLA
ncbi:MAG: hypothetical protein A2796_00695 [Chlamydiae bacterium RIFCSPHIGHO2_01_FULL_44_39]|nr:MAG: hypothetical protein A2796_00695 [Chlamydiae bacterium RIFCSPHIGHO2_01_FULL_44_39]OGN66593.1 MAG: hypothetical protein A2978_05305 [Chlamydiae bacterium RIFCSPLOWO2_01_FULL_44_52]OGN69842.1 MAG: hypothetical protein A3I67_07060 [Chlamydiae bacterium RIFCSPLOWO2_02_FULL_45_22]